MRGTIRSIISERGFGFLRSREHGSLFFHIRDTEWGDADFTDSLCELEVEFDIDFDEKSGKDRAINVRPAR